MLQLILRRGRLPTKRVVWLLMPYEVDEEVHYTWYLFRNYSRRELELHLFGATMLCDAHPWVHRMTGMRVSQRCWRCVFEIVSIR